MNAHNIIRDAMQARPIISAPDVWSFGVKYPGSYGAYKAHLHYQDGFLFVELTHDKEGTHGEWVKFVREACNNAWGDLGDFTIYDSVSDDFSLYKACIVWHH